MRLSSYLCVLACVFWLTALLCAGASGTPQATPTWMEWRIVGVGVVFFLAALFARGNGK